MSFPIEPPNKNMLQGVSPRDSSVPDRDVEPISAFQRRSDALQQLFLMTWICSKPQGFKPCMFGRKGAILTTQTTKTWNLLGFNLVN